MLIEIDNIEIEVFEGEMIINAAHRHGIDIPSLCYAADYQHQPSCMVCVVKNSETGQFVPSCSTVVFQGDCYESESDEVKALRRQSLELLLSDHIAVCRPPCKVERCKLRKYAIAYRAKWNRYPRYSAIKTTQPQQISDRFWFDVSKCIRCGLCVYNSKDGFTFKNRGFGMEVVLPNESFCHVDESLNDLCPTEALYIVNT